jgi:drug/metabolite transporter (DMT)-like permease
MTRQDWLLIVILSILWGGSFFFVALALQGFPPLTIVWARVGIASALLALAMRLRGLAFPARKAWPALLVMGVLNNALPFTCFVVAQGQITGALASILNATTPLFTVLVAHFLTQDERLTPAKALGLGFGFAGVVVMMTGAEWGGALLGKGLCLLAALSYGLAGVWGRRFRKMQVAPLATAFGMVTSAFVLLAPIVLWHDRPWALTPPGTVPLLAVLGLGGFSTALAYILFFRVLASAGPTKLSTVTFLVPVSATILGVGILGEQLLPQHLAGFALIALGLVALDGRVLRLRSDSAKH